MKIIIWVLSSVNNIDHTAVWIDLTIIRIEYKCVLTENSKCRFFQTKKRHSLQYSTIFENKNKTV